MRSTNFIDNAPAGTSDYKIMFAGENGSELAVLNAFYNDSVNVVIESSVNPGTLFDGAKSDLFTKLFKDQAGFMCS